MRRLAYDLCMLVGSSLIVAGVAIQFGLASALMAAGAAVIGMTLLAARVG